MFFTWNKTVILDDKLNQIKRMIGMLCWHLTEMNKFEFNKTEIKTN